MIPNARLGSPARAHTRMKSCEPDASSTIRIGLPGRSVQDGVTQRKHTGLAAADQAEHQAPAR